MSDPVWKIYLTGIFLRRIFLVLGVTSLILVTSEINTVQTQWNN